MWRTMLAGLCVLLGCAVAVVAVPMQWADRQLHADDFGETVRPLLQHPDVQRTVLDAASDAALPSGVQVPDAVVEELRSRLAVIVRTPAAERIWVRAGLTARDAVVDGDDSRIVVDLAELVDELVDELPAIGGLDLRSQIPPGTTTVVLADSPAVANARRASDLLETVAPVLPWLAAGLLAIALLVARRRLTTLGVAGIAIALGMLAVLGGLALGGERYLAGVGTERSRPVVFAAYEAFADSLRSEVMLVFGIAAGVGIVAIIASLLVGDRRRVR